MNNMVNNPMLALLNQSKGLSASTQTRNLSNVKNLINMAKSSRNPQAMLQQLISQNPQVQNVMQYVKDSGGDPKTAFYKMAEEKGVDPNEVLKMFQ